METNTPIVQISGELVREIEFKVLVVGESAVGKTSLVRRYVDQKYEDRYKSTIGSSYTTKEIMWKPDLKIRLHFWDLAGQDRLNNQTKVYYRQAAGALCVCDVSRVETRQQVLAWKDMVYENSTRMDGSQSHPPCVMVVNKMDLYGKDSTTSWIDSENLTSGEMVPVYLGTRDFDKSYSYSSALLEKIDSLAISLGFNAGCATSAADGIGIATAIQKLIELMLERYDQDERIREQEEIEQAKRVKLNIPVTIIDMPENRGRRNYCGGYC